MRIKLYQQLLFWYSVVIGDVSFVVGMTMVKKWYNVGNAVVTIYTSVSKVAKQLAGAITLLNSI